MAVAGLWPRASTYLFCPLILSELGSLAGASSKRAGWVISDTVSRYSFTLASAILTLIG